jgi:hypothetical protein
MKESIANSYIFGIVILFVGLIMLFFVASLNYTKAFKVKNKIINAIETYGEYNTKAKSEIEDALSGIGYRVDNSGNCKTDGRFSKGTSLTQLGNTNYRYCVYEFDQGERGKYYGVVAYMYFEIPLLGKTLEFPVYGETKTMGLLG